MKIKVNFKSLVLLALFSALSNFAIAQKTISGMVTDAESKEPLVGAAIVVTGTTKGTLTDVDGKYTLEAIPADATTLTFSFTGYANQTVTIGSSSTLDVALKGGSYLDEVVVTGYATVKQKEVTSAITTVKAEDFNKGNVNDPAQLLQGKVAGLTIARQGGSDPNGGFDIRLRGVSTISGNQQPLIIIDGVPGASLQTLDPNDIASFDVLKDGSAAAIYGTRGSNGVILITTKKGVAGVTKVEYNGQVNFENPANKVPVMSAAEFLAENEALNKRDPANAKPASDYNYGGTTDWFDQITRQGVSQVHNLSLSGGSKGTSYRASVNYRGVQGIALNDGFKQINGRFNLNQKALDDKLNLSMDIAITNRNADYSFNEAFFQALTYNPTVIPKGTPNTGFYNAAGYFEQNNFQYFNPLSILEQSSKKGTTDRLLSSFRAEYELAKGLKVSSQYSLTRDKEQFNEYFNKLDLFTRGALRNGSARQSTNDANTQLFNTLVSYNTEMGKLGFNAFAGYEIQDFQYRGFGAYGGDILSDKFGTDNLGASVSFKKSQGEATSYKNTSRLVAFFGRAAINFDDTYSFFASVRREGSTKFGENNKWGIFPAAGGAVTLSKLFSIPSVDNLKLRAGYGVTGNVPGLSYLSKSLYGPIPNSFFYYNGAYVPAYGPSRNSNPDLKWEKKSEINVGLDFALLDYKLTGTLDYYTRNTTDLLYEFRVPVPPNAADRTWANVGELTSSGFEIGLNYKAVQSSAFSWETGVNFSQNSINLVSLSSGDLKFGSAGGLDLGNVGSPGLNGTNQITVQEGFPLGEIWGRRYIRPKTAADVASLPAGERAGAIGTPLYEDINGDGKIDDAVGKDRVLLGNAIPKFTLGWNNSFKIGSAIDLNFFIRGVFGHSIVNQFRTFYEIVDPSSIRTKNVVKTTNFDPTLKNAEFSSRVVEKGDFIRLDNATIGYTIPMAKGGKISNIRVFLAGNNLLTFTGYTGIDPEAKYRDTEDGSYDLGGGGLAPGIERRNTYFTTRSFSVGVNVGF
jgi:TonB-dependent starch-binding outer membrane protein SusC